jgi:hypothetical protein
MNMATPIIETVKIFIEIHFRVNYFLINFFAIKGKKTAPFKRAFSTKTDLDIGLFCELLKFGYFFP